MRTSETAFILLCALLAFGLRPRDNRRRPAPGHLPYLDGVRALSAFWVFLAHVAIWGGAPWLPSPKIAVDVFMVHSGYLMVHHARRRPLSARDFWTRRFFRVTPGYWLSLILVFALGPWMLQGYSELRSLAPELWSADVIYDPWRIHFTATSFLVHATYVFGLIPAFAFSTMLPDWSISLEMQFYAVFPLLDRVLRRWWGPLTFVALVVGTIALTIWANHLPGPFRQRKGLFPEPSALPLKLTYFLVGMLVAQSVSSGRRWQAVLAFVLSWWGIVEARSLIVPAVVVYFAALGYASNEGLARRVAIAVLGNRVMRWGAEVSYGIYLYHAFALALLGGWLARLPSLRALEAPVRVAVLSVVLAPVVLGIAHVLYRLVERPGIEIGRRIIAKRRTLLAGAVLVTTGCASFHTRMDRWVGQNESALTREFGAPTEWHSTPDGGTEITWKAGACTRTFVSSPQHLVTTWRASGCE